MEWLWIINGEGRRMNRRCLFNVLQLLVTWRTGGSHEETVGIVGLVAVIRIMSLQNTRAVWKVRALALLLLVRTLWKCGDGLFFEVTPSASDALPTTLYPLRKRDADHWSLRNFLPRSSLFMVGKVQKSYGARSELNSVFWKKWIGGTSLEHPPYSPDFAPCDVWAFPVMNRELRGKKFRSDQWSAACSRKVGGAL
jgi:hypothetical protein